MAERFETRNVRNKEIYDSYMGILRISPNEVYGANVDDPTELLNTLYNNEKKQKTNVILSDSDGNILPVSFTPRAFEQIIKDPDTNKDVVSDVIHIVTKIGGDTGVGTVHISNKMVSRSTLLVSKSEKSEESRYSNIRILSGGQPSNSEGKIKGKGWLLYPTESPNDSHYFNDKNWLGLFNEDDKDSRKIQVEKSLKGKRRKWHEQNIPDTERVKVAGKSITILNDMNEEIPIYYSRDCVLGQYEGHHIKHMINEGNNVTNNSLQAWGTGTNDGTNEVDEITKLSWLRIDKIIWEALDEIVQGKLRHHKGRYDRLGTEPTIGKGLIEALGFGNTDTWKDKAPILGTETTRGSILYHAMPFHRYWFHRTKQVLRNFIERYKLMNKDTITEIKDTFKIGENGAEYLEMEELLDFLNDELITPNPIASRNYAVSLSKNFVICNGKTLSFDNYPNISLQNEKFFNFGGSYTATLTNGKFTQKEFAPGEAFYHLAMSTSENAQIIKVPNLFALYEKSPRFIRGLNWKNPTNTDEIVKIIDTSNATHVQNYVPASQQTGTYNQEICEGYSITKELKNCNKPYFHTYDNLIQKEQHQHHLFSSDEGGSGLPKNSKHDDIFIGYQCCNSTKGGNNNKRNKAFSSNHLGWNRTFSYEYIHQDKPESGSKEFRFSSPVDYWKKDDGWIKYCTNKIYNNGFFKTFTPIPNLGFFVFNSSIFNNKGEADVTYENNEITEGGLRGNIKYLSENGFFIDGEGAKHNVVNIFGTSSEETDNKELTDDEKKVQNLIDLDKKRQYLKYFAQKWNEAEGFIPISKQGKASGYIRQHWTVRERRGCKGYSRNPYEYTKQNIGGYLLAAPNLVSSDPHKNDVYWRCLTSIPYTNPKKLGVCADFTTWQDTKKSYTEDSDYYDINSVTQTPDYEKYKRYKFGNFPVEVDETCPTPYHMKFLPLIRI